VTASALYRGLVSHRRLLPRAHFLRYRVFQLYVDLDEAEALSQKCRLFGFNRRALLSLHERDHGDGSSRALKEQISDRATAAGLGAGGPVRVMCMPRVLGFVFNPITHYFVHDEAGSLSAVVHEVNNTIGGRCFYVLPATNSPLIAQHADKRMYVSPFMDMDYSYDFQLAEPGERFNLAIHMKREGALWLTAGFAGERRDFNDRELLLAWLAHPLLTLQVVAGIHWEALRIWLKGIKYRSPPADQPSEAAPLST